MITWTEGRISGMDLWWMHIDGAEVLQLSRLDNTNAYTVRCRMDYQNFGYTSNLAGSLENAKTEAEYWYYDLLHERIQAHKRIINHYKKEIKTIENERLLNYI